MHICNPSAPAVRWEAETGDAEAQASWHTGVPYKQDGRRTLMPELVLWPPLKQKTDWSKISSTTTKMSLSLSIQLYRLAFKGLSHLFCRVSQNLVSVNCIPWGSPQLTISPGDTLIYLWVCAWTCKLQWACGSQRISHETGGKFLYLSHLAYPAGWFWRHPLICL